MYTLHTSFYFIHEQKNSDEKRTEKIYRKMGLFSLTFLSIYH